MQQAPECDDGYVEYMIEKCLKEIDNDPDKFTSWEIGFIEEMEEWIEDRHLTDSQYKKLEEIYEDKVSAKD